MPTSTMTAVSPGVQPLVWRALASLWSWLDYHRLCPCLVLGAISEYLPETASILVADAGSWACLTAVDLLFLDVRDERQSPCVVNRHHYLLALHQLRHLLRQLQMGDTDPIGIMTALETAIVGLHQALRDHDPNT